MFRTAALTLILLCPLPASALNVLLPQSVSFDLIREKVNSRQVKEDVSDRSADKGVNGFLSIGGQNVSVDVSLLIPDVTFGF